MRFLVMTLAVLLAATLVQAQERPVDDPWIGQNAFHGVHGSGVDMTIEVPVDAGWTRWAEPWHVRFPTAVRMTAGEKRVFAELESAFAEAFRQEAGLFVKPIRSAMLESGVRTLVIDYQVLPAVGGPAIEKQLIAVYSSNEAQIRIDDAVDDPEPVHAALIEKLAVAAEADEPKVGPEKEAQGLRYWFNEQAGLFVSLQFSEEPVTVAETYAGFFAESVRQVWKMGSVFGPGGGHLRVEPLRERPLKACDIAAVDVKFQLSARADGKITPVDYGRHDRVLFVPAGGHVAVLHAYKGLGKPLQHGGAEEILNDLVDTWNLRVVKPEVEGGDG